MNETFQGSLTWDDVASLELSGRVFFLSETPISTTGTIKEIKLSESKNIFEIIDQDDQFVAGGSTAMCHAWLEDDGRIKITIYMIGSVTIFP